MWQSSGEEASQLSGSSTWHGKPPVERRFSQSTPLGLEWAGQSGSSIWRGKPVERRFSQPCGSSTWCGEPPVERRFSQSTPNVSEYHDCDPERQIDCERQPRPVLRRRSVPRLREDEKPRRRSMSDYSIPGLRGDEKPPNTALYLVIMRDESQDQDCGTPDCPTSVLGEPGPAGGQGPRTKQQPSK